MEHLQDGKMKSSINTILSSKMRWEWGKKILFNFFLIVIFSTITYSLSAQGRRGDSKVSLSEALDVGYAFMSSAGGQTRSNELNKGAMQLIYTGVASDSETTACYYVFALQPKGFVIVAADDHVEPILGYSYDNNFAVENMPEQVRGWLDGYSTQIKQAIDNDVAADAENSAKWSQLRAGQYMTTRSGEDVGPLLTTTWDQGQYYNSLCPTDANSPTGYVYIGNPTFGYLWAAVERDRDE